MSQEPTEVGSAEFPPPFLSRADSFISGGLQLENLRGELYQSWQACEWADEGEMKHQLDPQIFFEIFQIDDVRMNLIENPNLDDIEGRASDCQVERLGFGKF